MTIVIRMILIKQMVESACRSSRITWGAASKSDVIDPHGILN